MRLMLTRGNENLDPQRAMLVYILIEGMKIKFGQIIVNELFVRTQKKLSALSIPCLITELCRQANVPIIQGVDNKVWATK